MKGYFLRCDENNQYRGYLGEIDNELSALQDYVGGLIEVYTLANGVDLIFNEEGKIHRLPYNRILLDDETKTPIDCILGNIICVRSKDGEFIDIDDNDVGYIEGILLPLKNILSINKEIIFETYSSDECPEWDIEQS